MLYCVALCCPVLSCVVLSCLVLSCLVVVLWLSCGCLVLFCLVLFCHVLSSLSCLVLSSLSCLGFSVFVLSCLALSGLVWSGLVWSCLVWSCLVWSCLALSCLVLSCLVLSCLELSCVVLSRLSCLVNWYLSFILLLPLSTGSCLCLPVLVAVDRSQGTWWPLKASDGLRTKVHIDIYRPVSSWIFLNLLEAWWSFVSSTSSLPSFVVFAFCVVIFLFVSAPWVMEPLFCLCLAFLSIWALSFELSAFCVFENVSVERRA